MGLLSWIKRLFGASTPPGDWVRYYDIDTRKVVHIPASELAPGTVRAQVEGVEGEVWISADQLKLGEVLHPPFDEEVREIVRRIQKAFSEPFPQTLGEWESGFRRDRDPTREIALWLHAAGVYEVMAGPMASANERKAVFQVIAACMTSSPDKVRHVLPPTGLAPLDVDNIISRFYGCS